MASGIYKITDLRNNKIYIGRATDLDNRKWRHFCYCDINNYTFSSIKTEINMKIHQAMIESGNKNDFLFEVIEECPKEKLNEREKYYIKFFNSLIPNGYNSTEGGDSYPHLQGENHPNHKITLEQSKIIKKMLYQGKTVKEIIEIIPQATMGIISSINNGRSWYDSDIKYPISSLNGVKKLSKEDIKFIRELRIKGSSCKELAKKYKTSSSNISNITIGKTRTNIEGKISKAKPRNLLTKEQIEECRLYYSEHDIQIKDLWSNFTKKYNNNIGYDSFKQMIEGHTYKQYASFPKKDFKKIRNNLIIELNKKGLTKKEIAEKANCSIRTVYRVIENE